MEKRCDKFSSDLGAEVSCVCIYGKADLDTMIGKINRMGETELWQDDSPI